MRELIAYGCDHCGKIYKQKSVVKMHEKKCYSNPDTLSCATCAKIGCCSLNGDKLKTNCLQWQPLPEEVRWY